MDERDFDKWLDDYCGYFPGLLSWLQRQNNPRRIKEGWKITLDRFDHHLLGRVTNGMLRGDIAPVQPTDYPLFAHHIKAAASKLHEHELAKARRIAQAKQPTAGAWEMATTGSNREAYLACCAVRRMAREMDKAEDCIDWVAKQVVQVYLGDTDDDKQDAEAELHRFGINVDEVRRQVEDATALGIARSVA
jgi:hypothetical protein